MAYTIAVVQNSQTLQYDQMHVALQTAQNQASLETPLRAEQLMTTHFNLAVLANETKTNKTIDAQKPETTTVDAELSTWTADEETYIKIPSRHNAANRNPKKAHPTGAVVPTCRRDYGLVNGIPAGYETDDSWDHNSLTHEPEHTHTHTHNIVPLLALHTWTNHPNRGREQLHRQNNNKCEKRQCTIPKTLGRSALRTAHKEPTGSPCQSISQVATQVPSTIDFYTGVALASI